MVENWRHHFNRFCRDRVIRGRIEGRRGDAAQSPRRFRPIRHDQILQAQSYEGPLQLQLVPAQSFSGLLRHIPFEKIQSPVQPGELSPELAKDTLTDIIVNVKVKANTDTPTPQTAEDRTAIHREIMIPPSQKEECNTP